MDEPTTPEYDALPESIKARLTFQEWKWLPDQQRARVVDDYIVPEVEL